MAYLKPNQISKEDLFVKTVNSFQQPLTVFAKTSILYASLIRLWFCFGSFIKICINKKRLQSDSLINL